MATKRPTFRTLNPTAPSADGAAPTSPETQTADAQASRRQDVQASRRQDASTAAVSAPARSAFTWRLTPDEAIRIDSLALRLRGDLGHRLDRATMLSALCRMAATDPAIYAALLTELRDV